MRLMISLVSPKYDLRDFCQCTFGKDPLQVIDSASAEIAYARLIHQEKTNDRNFRRGSRGRVYCDDLQQLISLFMGSTPDKVSPQFLDAVKPPALHLLQKWEIVGLRQVVAHPTEPTPLMELGEITDFLMVLQPRHKPGFLSTPSQRAREHHSPVSSRRV
jgi:hypothetical protein